MARVYDPLDICHIGFTATGVGNMCTSLAPGESRQLRVVPRDVRHRVVSNAASSEALVDFCAIYDDAARQAFDVIRGDYIANNLLLPYYLPIVHCSRRTRYSNGVASPQNPRSIDERELGRRDDGEGGVRDDNQILP